MATKHSTPGAPLAPGPLRLADAALRNVDILYHTVPVENLATLTTRKLEEAGFPLEALGRMAGSRMTITACVVLPSHARSTVPPALGGDADTFSVSSSTDVVLRGALDRSPSAGASLGPSRDASPSAWVTPTRSPPRAPPGAPTSAEKARALRAAAALAETASELEAELAEATAAEDDALGTLAAVRRRSSRIAAHPDRPFHTAGVGRVLLPTSSEGVEGGASSGGGLAMAAPDASAVEAGDRDADGAGSPGGGPAADEDGSPEADLPAAEARAESAAFESAAAVAATAASRERRRLGSRRRRDLCHCFERRQWFNRCWRHGHWFGRRRRRRH